MLIYAMMLACAAGLAIFFYRYDLHEKEPWYMVVLAVGLGFAVMWLAGMTEDAVSAKFPATRQSLASRAALVTAVEESARLVIVFTIALLFRSHFKDALDGLMYGTLGGLGMAVEESLLYLSLSPATLQTLGAEIVRLFAHSLMGGLVGFAVGMALRPGTPKDRRPLLTVGCVMVSILVHFSWDLIAYQPNHTALLRGLPMLLMLSLMMVWGGLVAFASERSRPNYQPAARRGRWGPPRRA